MADSASVYAAEEAFLGDTLELDEAALRIEPEAVASWCSQVAHAAGWADPQGGPPQFRIAFDLPAAAPDVAEWSGYYEVEAGIIHLDPRVLSRFLVLHELAHAIDWRDGHGPGFRRRMIGLTASAFGQKAAVELSDYYAEYALGQEGCG